MKIAEHSGAEQNEKSGQEVAKCNSGHFPKTDVRHWQGKLFKPSYQWDGEKRFLAEWAVRLQWRGRRELFNLGTSNKVAAVAKARDVFLSLQAHGWDATLTKFKPEMQRKAVSTVGQLIEELRGHWSGQPATFADYCQKFRFIVAQIFAIESGAESGWRAKRMEKINRVKIADVTPERVNKWRIAFVKRAGDNPVEQRRARISCNSFIRMAKSLFAPDLLRHVTMQMPEKLPFEGVPFYPRESMRYHSGIEIEKLIGEALTELAQEPLKIFLLGGLAGLRRNEIDKLQWDAFRWNEGVIRIEATDYFTPKTAESAGDVPVDPELTAMFRGWHAKASGPFVIEADAKPRTGTRFAYYRAQEHFETLTAWLRGKGVTAPKPLHELRKEFGSQICAKAGIYAASRMLRHTDIALTAKHYLDTKERVTVGLGKLLPVPENVTPMEAAV